MICRGVMTLCGSSRIAFSVCNGEKQLVIKAYKLKRKTVLLKELKESEV